jgi:hypothetical protein
MNVGRYGFYELLAQAALEHLAGNQPEPEDARPLLRAMLTRAFLMLEVAKENHASREMEDGIWEIGSSGRWKVEGGRIWGREPVPQASGGTEL